MMIIRIDTLTKHILLKIDDAMIFETRQSLLHHLVALAIDECERLGLEFTGFEIIAE